MAGGASKRPYPIFDLRRACARDRKSAGSIFGSSLNNDVIGWNAIVLIVTDQIRYFPGNRVARDPNEPMIAQPVDGDTLYARVMRRMEAPVRTRTGAPLPPGRGALVLAGR